MKQKHYKEYLTHMIPCIVFGLLTGVLTGGSIFLFKFLAGRIETLSRSLYTLATESRLAILLVFLVLTASAFLMSFLHKAVPECKGGGIPRSEGILRGILSFRWAKTLLGTFFGSLLSFFAGLPCGSEGPAVLIGTSLGCMIGSCSKKYRGWNRYIMSGGAGAGFAVATGAPLSGILFALEEIHKRFSPMLLLTVSTAVLSASGVNQLLCSSFAISPSLFTLDLLPSFSLAQTGYLLLLAVLIFVAVALFDGSILLFGHITSHSPKSGRIPRKLLITFLIGGYFCLVLPDAAYSGHHLINHILENHMTVSLLLVLFLIRLAMMLLITDSGATGGIFIPTLAIGALSAALIAKLLVLFGMPADFSTAVIFLGMCAFIGGTLRAPLTASVLFLELSGQFTNLFYVALVIFTVSLLTETLNLMPFYDKALEHMTQAEHKGKTMMISNFTLTVAANAIIVGKAVRDIMWPHASVIMSLTYGSNHKVKMDDGEQRLYAGDKITIRAGYYDLSEILELLKGLAGDEQPITIEHTYDGNISE